MNVRRTSLILAIVSLFTLPLTSLLASGNQEIPAASTELKGFPRGNALISVAELAKQVEAKNPKLVIIAAEGAVSFALGHIPGAQQVDRPAYAATPETQNGVSGNILAQNEFTAFARSLGVNQDSQVVIYDDDYDATRLWWAFTYYGKNNVRVLDGNFATWRDAGYPVSLLGADKPVGGNFIAEIKLPSLRIDTDELASLLDSQDIQVWDTRDLEEYTGAAQRNGAVRAGRIPEAKFNTWTSFKTPENKAVYKTYAEIAAQLKELGYSPDKHQIFYCQSGVRSTQALFALYLAGWPIEKLRNYDSSWIGWSRSNYDLVKGE